MAIHIDTDGNFYFGASGTTDFDSLSYTPVFSVTKEGVLTATSGTIGGWTLGSDYLRAQNSNNQYIYLNADGSIAGNFISGTQGWRINANGDAEFNEVTIRVKGNSSDPSPSGVGDDFISIGDSFIYDYSGSLTLLGNKVRIKDGNGGSETSPSLTFSVGFDDPGFYTVQDNSLTQAKLYWSSGTNNIIHSESDYDTLYIDAANIAIGSDIGQPNEFIGKDGSGNLGWHSVSGSSHPDSDHTSFLDTSDGDARYVRLINQSAHFHTSYDNYGSWSINGNTVSSGQGVTIQGQNKISVSTSSRTVTIEHDDNDHSFSSGITNISSNGNATGSTVSFTPSGTTARFLSSIVASGSTVTFNRTATTTADITTGTLTSRDHFGSGYSLGNAGLRWGAIWLTSSPQVSSDERLKTDIVDLDYGLDFINDLTPKKFKMGVQTLYRCTESQIVFATNKGTEVCSTCQDNEEVDNCTLEEFTEAITDDDRYGFGFSAQDVNEVLDINTNKVVSHDDDNDVYTIGYEQLIAPLVKAVQELSTQISELTARVEALEG